MGVPDAAAPSLDTRRSRRWFRAVAPGSSGCSSTGCLRQRAIAGRAETRSWPLTDTSRTSDVCPWMRFLGVGVVQRRDQEGGRQPRLKACQCSLVRANFSPRPLECPRQAPASVQFVARMNVVWVLSDVRVERQVWTVGRGPTHGRSGFSRTGRSDGRGVQLQPDLAGPAEAGPSVRPRTPGHWSNFDSACIKPVDPALGGAQ